MKMDTILQWNIRGLRSNLEELRLLMGHTDPAVVALQETKLTDDRPPLRGFSFLVSGDGAPGGEAGLLIRNDITFSELNINTNLHAVAAKVSFKNCITICSLYLPPNTNISKTALTELFGQLPKPFLVLGDYNAHSPSWGDSRRDGRGAMLEEFIHENNYIVLNSGEQTFIHSGHHTTSAIDLSVASPSIATDFSWAVHDDLCGSDHLPIVMKAHGNSQNNFDKKLNLNKANWDLFRDLCGASIDGAILEADCPASSFANRLVEAAQRSIPFHKGKKFQRVPWFSADCKTAIHERKKAQRKFFQNPSVENLINFKRLKAKSKFIIKQAKITSWKSYVSTINNNTSTKTVWKKIQKIKGREPNPRCHLKKNDELITDNKEHANYLAETFSKNSSSNNYSNNFRKIKTTKEKNKINFSSENLENYNNPFILSELTESLKKSNQSAPGPDGIYYQFLTHLPEPCLKILLQIFNSIWITGDIPNSWKEATVIPIPKPGKDPSDPNSYRPIALTSCLCKTMERLVNNRLVWVLETEKLLSKFQCGFRKSNSTLDI